MLIYAHSRQHIATQNVKQSMGEATGSDFFSSRFFGRYLHNIGSHWHLPVCDGSYRITYNVRIHFSINQLSFYLKLYIGKLSLKF